MLSEGHYGDTINVNLYGTKNLLAKTRKLMAMKAAEKENI